MLRVSVPFQISGGELDSSSGPFSGWGGGVSHYYNEKVELQIPSCLKFFTDFSFDPLLHFSYQLYGSLSNLVIVLW